jgi:chromosome partitioning protein
MTLIISVAQQKGGAGKTTISTNIAVCLSNLGKKVGLIDLDPQQSAGMWYELRQNNIADNMIDLLLHDYILDNVLKTHCGHYDIIVIDTPPHAKDSALKLIRRSDFVIIPAQLSPMDIWATQPILDMALETHTPHFMVLNRVPYASKVSDKLRESLIESKLPLSQTAIGNRNSYVAAFLQGSGVTLTTELLSLTKNSQKQFVAHSFA